MVGIVVVSHSRRLADAAVELALQMVRGTSPPIEVAAGLDDHVLGTDAARVKEAIDRVASPDGVIVLMDLGSAVLSAELALELRGGTGECPIVLSDAPIVEGLVAAVALSAAGATLAEVAADAAEAGHIKTRLLGVGTSEEADLHQPATAAPGATIELVLHNEHGLHARPAARFVETVRRFDAEVTVRNGTTGGAAVSGRSVSALSTLGVPNGDQIQVTANGRQAREALAAIAALVRRNFDDPMPVASPARENRSDGPIAASPGIGIGPKVSLPETSVAPTHRAPGSVAGETDRLHEALETTRADLNGTRDRVVRTAGAHEGEIFDAHLLLLDDDELVGAAFAAITSELVAAEDAWQVAVQALAARFEELSDEYLRARAADVRAVGAQVLGHLTGQSAAPTDALTGVLVASDLTPTQAAHLDPTSVTGIVVTTGSPVSHGAILARALGIPAVVGAGSDVLGVPDGVTLVVDGTEGTVVVDPSPDVLEQYRVTAEGQRRRASTLLEAASRPAITTDGVSIEVAANIASRTDAVDAVDAGADSVGLLRTEFLFLDRRQPPDEEEQTEAYLSIASALDGRRLTVRTLDIGGDKPVPYLPAAANEANPFLGLRGLRLSLRHPDIFKQQLRALVRAGMQHPITVLFPMVTTVDELRSARVMLFDAATEVGCAAGDLPAGFEIGAMAEVPSFALHARAAVGLVDVISIGTNDLTQYTLAAERGNAEVATLADSLDPAVLRLVSEVAGSATARARVAVCGELAADPIAAALLVGLGVRELSMTPRAIPAVKDAIRSMSVGKAKQLAGLALQRDSAASVRALLSDLA